jgi:anti-sigma B factor antagonist
VGRDFQPRSLVAGQSSKRLLRLGNAEQKETMAVDLAIIEDTPQGWTHVRLRGDLDIATAPDLRERLLDILDRLTPSGLILDLSMLDFIDSSGTAVLVRTERRARLLGCMLVLVAPRAQVARVFQICGLDQHFLIYKNVAAAVERAPTDSRLEFRLALAPAADEAEGAAT